MGQVFLDSENLFFGFGWTPTATEQDERRQFLSQFVAAPRLERMYDVLAVETLASSAVHALAAWVRNHFSAQGHCVDAAFSYGKLDRGVTTVLVPLAVEGFKHVEVRWGRDVAEKKILGRLDRERWARGPYVIGTCDRIVLDAMCQALARDPRLGATLVMRPDLYVRRRFAWFDSREPGREAPYALLGEYGIGHVALHRLTDDWLAGQSGTRARRAVPTDPARTPADLVPPEELWATWLRHAVPKPSQERPLSSTDWVRAARNRGVPAGVFRPLRDAVVALYGEAFELGDGPVSWGSACRAAASIPLVRVFPASPPTGLEPLRLRGYEEAKARMMTRRSGNTGET